MEKSTVYYATGKRKNAIARTWLTPGKGEIIVNDTVNNKWDCSLNDEKMEELLDDIKEMYLLSEAKLNSKKGLFWI